MTLLDENTKAMLDAGKVAVLEGGYIVVTPETLRQTVKNTTMEVFGDVISAQTVKEEANDSSINRSCQCRFCGKKSNFTEYIMTISGGYDSDHDMETVSMNVCAGCLEKMLAAVS